MLRFDQSGGNWGGFIMRVGVSSKVPIEVYMRTPLDEVVGLTLANIFVNLF